MNKIIPVLVAVIICFSVGVMASYFQVDAIQTWYPFLNKPSLTPPNFITLAGIPTTVAPAGISFGDIDRTNMEY
mgnify:CR=1 FL=1